MISEIYSRLTQSLILGIPPAVLLAIIFKLFGMYRDYRKDHEKPAIGTPMAH